MASEATHMVSACEDHLKRERVQTELFSDNEIQGGLLKEFLTVVDYLTPFEVNIFLLFPYYDIIYASLAILHK